MGLRTLVARDWIEPDEDLGAQLRIKSRLLRERRTDVLRTSTGSEAAQAELLEMLAAHLPERFPRVWTRSRQRMEIEGAPAVDLDDADAPPIETASRLVQEDLCILAPSPGGYVLAAASLCAPSYWRLADKIGRPLTEIHAPVPGYATKLAGPVDRFFETLEPDRCVWRCNWSVTTSSRLFQPSREEPDPLAAREITTENAGDLLFVRVERQTLRRLPRTESVVFTIKVYVDPVSALDERPSMKRALADAVEALTPAELAYKDMTALRSPLLRHLRRA
jgi:hypothetical protein